MNKLNVGRSHISLIGKKYVKKKYDETQRGGKKIIASPYHRQQQHITMDIDDVHDKREKNIF
jgi:hypothetical protein